MDVKEILLKQNELLQSTRVKAVNNAYNIKCLAVIGSGFTVLFIAFMVAVMVTV